jgi:protein tyrosine phosphatase
VGDFWRLIWDYNIPSVVMLTNLMEKMKVKCSQYWPNSGSQQYAHINVTLINTIQQADFTIRHFQIKSVSICQK